MPSSHQNQARSPAFHSIRSSAFHRISHQAGWLTSCNTGLKVISAHRNSPAHIIRPLVTSIYGRKLNPGLAELAVAVAIAERASLLLVQYLFVYLFFAFSYGSSQLSRQKEIVHGKKK